MKQVSQEQINRLWQIKHQIQDLGAEARKIVLSIHEYESREDDFQGSVQMPSAIPGVFGKITVKGKMLRYVQKWQSSVGTPVRYDTVVNIEFPEEENK